LASIYWRSQLSADGSRWVSGEEPLSFWQRGRGGGVGGFRLWTAEASTRTRKRTRTRTSCFP